VNKLVAVSFHITGSPAERVIRLRIL